MQGQGATRLLLAALIVVAAAAFPVLAHAAPEDQPAIDQYADPFGPLPTRERDADFDPLSGSVGAPPRQLLRRLAQVPESDRGALAALVTQIRAAKHRVSAGAPERSRKIRSRTASDADSDVLDAPVASLFDIGGPGPWIMAAAAALAGAAALRARALHAKKPS